MVLFRQFFNYVSRLYISRQPSQYLPNTLIARSIPSKQLLITCFAARFCAPRRPVILSSTVPGQVARVKLPLSSTLFVLLALYILGSEVNLPDVLSFLVTFPIRLQKLKKYGSEQEQLQQLFSWKAKSKRSWGCWAPTSAWTAQCDRHDSWINRRVWDFHQPERSAWIYWIRWSVDHRVGSVWRYRFYRRPLLRWTRWVRRKSYDT